MLPEPEFPSPARFGGRLRFDACARDPEQPLRFVDVSDVCADLGIDRRTLGRRIRGRIRGEAGDADAPD